MQKQLEWATQKKREAFCVQEFNKRSVRVVTLLRELQKLRNRIIKQFVSETRDCRHKTAMSDYFTNEGALTADNANFVKHLKSTHLKKGAFSRSASWQSSLEASRRETWEKEGKASYQTTITNATKSRTHGKCGKRKSR